MATLEVEKVGISFGGQRALDEASFSAEAGQVTGLIGPNGAGKTTMFNVVTGLLSPSSGTIRLDGRDITGFNLHKRARAGLARTFQRLELFTMLSVRENIRVAADVHRRWSRDRTNTATATQSIIELLGLGPVADSRVTSIPTGQGRLVELGRAIACKPRVLLLDEPASGQDDNETERFGRILLDLASTGMAVVMVEHDMALVMNVCNQVNVLDLGRMIATGAPAEVQSNPQVVEAYLGKQEQPA